MQFAIQYQWDYRVNGKPVKDCIVPGGWNNGLYVISEKSSASLERVATRAAAEYRTLCADVLETEK